MSQDRRTFLKTTGAALGAAAVGSSCAPDGMTRQGGTTGRGFDLDILRAVGALVLPSELGDAGREQAVQGFERWAAAYEPVPELNHGYGTSEIRYGPADPAPGWAAQLRALDLEARKRTGAGFAALEREGADALLRRHIGEPGTGPGPGTGPSTGPNTGIGMPSPLRAEHVAVALLSWWLATPEATDRCYGVRISPETCRGIATAPAEPETVA